MHLACYYVLSHPLLLNPYGMLLSLPMQPGKGLFTLIVNPSLKLVHLCHIPSLSHPALKLCSSRVHGTYYPGYIKSHTSSHNNTPSVDKANRFPGVLSCVSYGTEVPVNNPGDTDWLGQQLV